MLAMSIQVYACKICPKIFTNKANFDFHVQRHTNPDLKRKKYGTIDNSGPATCEFCNKVFSSRSGLDYHIKVQLIVKQFV